MNTITKTTTNFFGAFTKRLHFTKLEAQITAGLEGHSKAETIALDSFPMPANQPAEKQISAVPKSSGISYRTPGGLYVPSRTLTHFHQNTLFRSSLQKKRHVLWTQVRSYSTLPVIASFEEALSACKEGNSQLIAASLQTLQHMTDEEGRTLFMYAVASWDEELIKELSKYKSLVHQRDREGNTALHIAAATGNTNHLSLLLQDLNMQEKNNRGETPIHTAILAGQEEVLRIFVEKEKNLDPLEWQSLTLTPLNLAVIRGEMGCIDVLLKEGEITGIPGIGNPLHLAVRFHLTEVIEHLVTKHQKIFKPYLEEKNAQGLTPFALAACFGEIEALWILKNGGADIHARDHKERTPLHHAALHYKLDVIDLLAHFKVKLMATDKDGYSALALIDAKIKEMSDPLPEALSTLNRLRDVIRTKRVEKVPEQSVYASPENLVFKGGGPKGGAYAGVLRSLENRNLINGVRRTAGSSAGALTAAMVAFGYNAKEAEELLLHTDLMSFLDHPLSKKRMKEAMGLTGDGSIIRTLSRTYETIANVANGSIVTKIFHNLYSTTGLCKGDAMRDWIESLIDKKVEEIAGRKIKDLTFGELRELINQGYPFKHFHIYTTQVGASPKILHLSSEDPACDSYIIHFCVIASMAIPGVFEPQYIYLKQGNDRVIYKKLGPCLDGGVLYNYPESTFDEERYQTTKDLGEEGRLPRFNKRTLGFTFSSPKAQVDQENSVETVGDLLTSFATLFYNAEEKFRELNPSSKKRTIEIDPGEIGTLSFALKEVQKKELVERGFAATEQFFAKLNPVAVLNPGHPLVVRRRIHLSSPLSTFVGREPTLEVLKTAFIAQGWRPTDPSHVKVIYGSGGIGKSELAITFGNRYLDHFSLIWFIRCESKELYDQDYLELAESLKIPILKGENNLIQKVHKRLENGIETKKPWLLILDNVETPPNIPERGGCVLMTSQDKKVWHDQTMFLEVPPFTPEESLQLLEKKGKEATAEQINRLTVTLEGHPILLDQAIDSIATYHTMEDYLSSIQKQGIPVWQSQGVGRYPRALGATFDLAFKAIQKKNQTAYAFLEVCAYLNPEYIPMPFFDFWLELTGKSEEKVPILNLLVDTSTFRFDEKRKIFSMHRSKQIVLKKITSEEKYKEVVRYLTTWAESFSFGNNASWEIGESCFFQLSTLKSAPLWEAEEYTKLIAIIGAWVTRVKGDPKQGLFLQEEVLSSRKKNLEENDPILAFSYNEVGFCKILLGNFQEAFDLFHKALGIYKEEESGDVAKCLNNIGLALTGLGKYQEALSFQQRALEMRKKVLGEKHPSVGLSYNTMGSCLWELGQYEKSLLSYQEALTVYNNVYGGDSPYVANSLNNIGMSLFAFGQYEQALDYSLKALEIYSRGFDKEYFEIGTCYNNIGMNLEALGKGKEALEYHQKALIIRKKVFGSHHPDVAMSYNNIAMSLYSLGSFDRAKQCITKGIEIRKAIYGENHPSLASSYSNMGLILGSVKDHQRALEYKKQALEIREKAFGVDHPDVAMSHNNLAISLGELGFLSDALNHQLDAFRISCTVYNKKHPNQELYLQNLIGFLGEFEKNATKEVRQQAISISSEIFGENDSFTDRLRKAPSKESCNIL